MYLFKTCKKPFNHLEFNCGARLTNCVSKFLCGFNGQHLPDLCAVCFGKPVYAKIYSFE